MAEEVNVSRVSRVLQEAAYASMISRHAPLRLSPFAQAELAFPSLIWPFVRCAQRPSKSRAHTSGGISPDNCQNPRRPTPPLRTEIASPRCRRGTPVARDTAVRGFSSSERLRPAPDQPDRNERCPGSVRALLESTGTVFAVASYRPRAVIFFQGQADAAAAPHPARGLGSIRRAHPGEAHPPRSRSDGSAPPFQREAPGAHPPHARRLRRAGLPPSGSPLAPNRPSALDGVACV